MVGYSVKKEDLIEIVREAGIIAMRFYEGKYDIVQKKDNTPVTDADMAVHDFLVEHLSRYGYPILSEEGKENAVRIGKAKYMWVIDPIDGTLDFIDKTGEFSIMVGLTDAKGKSVVGVVYAPVADELYFGEKGGGAFLLTEEGEKRLQVNEKPLQNGTLLVSRHYKSGWEKEIAQKYNMKCLPMGSAGIKMCKIATGAAELYINSSSRCALWDVCAGDVIVRESGGHICNTTEKEILYNVDETKLSNGYVVSNACVHDCVHVALARHAHKKKKSDQIFKKILI